MYGGGDRKGKVMKNKAVIGAAAVILVVVVVVGGRMLKKEEADVAVELPVVRIESPTVGDIELMTDIGGSIEPQEVVYVYPETSGTVTEVCAQTGDQVQAGQVLCRMDIPTLDTLENSMQSARIAMEQAQKESARQTELYQLGYISQQDYEQIRNSADTAKLSYERAKMEYERQVEYSNIVSPIDGSIETFDAEVFDKVSPSTQLCVVSGVGGKIVACQLTAALKDAAAVGDPVWTEQGNTVIEGSIYEISTMVDPVTGLYKMKAALSEGDALATGMTVKVSLISENARNTLLVPVDAVNYESGKPYLYTYEEGTVHKIFFEAGIYDSEKQQVLSGVQPEDQIITTWSPELYEGAQVRAEGIQ